MQEEPVGHVVSGETPSLEAAQVVLVYVTAPTPDEGERMAQRLVEERLAACVNVVGGVASFYWWEGLVQREGEVLLLVKTRAAVLERLVARVRELSSYEVPASSALPVVGGNPEYLRWVVREVRA
ncbi:divalent-cation tolerance protein CutA [Limnochorda pilosa]|uniref:Divalent-cation tolerance protein CutA n=1 Tax=Limnochorda pilosa TaxID=1555112 RepID=A0A0K2SII6_LIMPI|nr:divalent-cation tolerance protein CutA [Limnochorda pilosa]BAS26941.1 hypothetical protein LIP_1084 [Limnochorda pilosa]